MGRISASPCNDDGDTALRRSHSSRRYRPIDVSVLCWLGWCDYAVQRHVAESEVMLRGSATTHVMTLCTSRGRGSDVIAEWWRSR